MAKANLTADQLRALLEYSPETGAFTWRTTGMGRPPAGAEAGAIDRSHGYRVVCVNYHRDYAHRLAVLYMTGEWPAGLVDHINGIRHDNRWANLRVGPRRLNQENRRTATANSASGLLGAHKKRNRWSSTIVVHGKIVKLGSFRTAEEAHSAYVAAKRLLHEGCTI